MNSKSLLPITRWTAPRKAGLVKAYLSKQLTLSEILITHNISDEEFQAWVDRYRTQGTRALKVFAKRPSC